MLTFKDLVFVSGVAECDFGNGKGIVVCQAKEWHGFFEMAVVTATGMGDVSKGLSPNDISTKMVELQAAPLEFIPGHRYLLTTEKIVKLTTGGPAAEVVKRATYAVDVVSAAPTGPKSWAWIQTVQPHIAMNRTGRKYLLCALAKKSGYYTPSKFWDPLTGKEYTKGMLSAYLPEKGRYGDVLTIPLDTIKQADDVTPCTADVSAEAVAA